MKSHFKKGKEKTQKPLWLLGFLRRYLNRFALLVAGGRFELPTITLRCPKSAVTALAVADFDRGRG